MTVFIEMPTDWVIMRLIRALSGVIEDMLLSFAIAIIELKRKKKHETHVNARKYRNTVFLRPVKNKIK